MSVSTHYDEEALIALLDRPRAASNDEHVAECPTCAAVLDSYRSMIETLGEKPVWNFGRIVDEPVKKTITALRAAAASMRSEDEEAEALFAELTSGPREWWMPRLMADAKYRTAAMVRRLSVASDGVALKSPGDDLELTLLATEIADHLDDTLDPVAVARLRGSAWRDRAYALNYAGQSADALDAAAASDRHFAAVPLSDLDRARLELTKAQIFRALEKYDEGLAAVRNSRKAFVESQDFKRLHTAKSIEAHLMLRKGDVRGALSLWLELESEVDDAMRGAVNQNIAFAYRALGDIDASLKHLERAIQANANAGQATNLLKNRWAIANLLMLRQRYAEAEVVFREVIPAFAEIQMREDVILANLELSELLIIENRFDEAVAICKRTLEELRASGLEQTSRALTAVSYLAEATAQRKATAALARQVHDFVRDARTQPALLFAPLPL